MGFRVAQSGHRSRRLQSFDLVNVDLELLGNGLNALLVGKHTANRILLWLGQHGALLELPAVQGAPSHALSVLDWMRPVWADAARSCGSAAPGLN